ncbi:MAG: hypothetical protein FWB97_03125, partial [Oscillospiraceae bacterium]|nr:hypothetical protein [Oscillospiraceae bacterium]
YAFSARTGLVALHTRKKRSKQPIPGYPVTCNLHHSQCIGVWYALKSQRRKKSKKFFMVNKSVF